LHSFYSDPWEFGWEALVAIATFALAAVTVVLAWRTSKMVSKTADLADFTKQDVALSRTAIEAGVRPVLVTVPRGEFVHPMGQNYEVHVPGTGARRGHPDRAVVYVQDVGGRLFVSVPARNSGAGIAFVHEPTLEWHGAGLTGEISSAQVPLQELTRASFSFQADGDAPTLDSATQVGSLIVKVSYSDLAGNVWASKFTLVPAPEIGPHDWKVDGFELSHEGRTEAVASGTA
jgi:hypothetical protein